ncbi:unnamed protein product [Phaedon cochleariae]|uniref:acid phosphatase n=1 Tax=Phaedon cochleariae TaxID=80249 RepID=A0A9N9X4K1_PHACE|nr:unnamed protein product [Phaedon cochleariae]
MVLRNMLSQNTEPKLFLYTGHENNINNILFAMGIEEPHFPNYSATVVFELHSLEIENRTEFAVKVVHINGPDQNFVVKQLKGCDVLCPLNKFQELTKDVVPVNYTRECESTKNLDA